MKPLMNKLLDLNNVNYYDKVDVYGYPRISNNGSIYFKSGVKLFSTNAYYLSAGFVPNVLLKTYKHGKIIICENVELNGTTIISADSVYIGRDTMIGNNYFISDTDIHSTNPLLRLEVCTGNVNINEVWIGENVWIGSNVIILKGVNIGDNSIIGIGSVVTKSFPNNVIIAGNPAKIVKGID